MTENTAFDFVWLGLLIGVFDLGDEERGRRMLLDQLADMGLGVTLTKVHELWSAGQLDRYESDDIAKWVGEELDEQTIRFASSSPFDVNQSFADLINSWTPGVRAALPEIATKGFVEAGRCIENGTLDAAALLLVRCVESMMRDFYGQLTGTLDESLTWNVMENNLFDLANRDHNNRELRPVLYFLKSYRIDHRNPVVHEGKEYDEYEAKRLFHLSTEAVTRMALFLNRRFCPPGIA